MIDLPRFPRPAAATPSLVDFGVTLRPPLGGPVQRINRLGNRWKLSVSLPPLKSAKAGRQWVAALAMAKSEGARMEFPQPGFDVGSPGSPVVDGAGQTGTTLSIRGGQPNYTWRLGQFFSIETAGQHYLCMVAAETANDDDGNADLPIRPMIRVEHADGDAVHAGRPMIEGLLSGDEFAWQLSLGHFTGIEFEIEESA